MENKINKKIEKMNKYVEKPLKVRFCPECKSTDVKFVFKMKNLFGLLPRVECTRCGYKNVYILNLVVTKKDLNRKIKKMKKKHIKKNTKKDVKKISKVGKVVKKDIGRKRKGAKK